MKRLPGVEEETQKLEADLVRGQELPLRETAEVAVKASKLLFLCLTERMTRSMMLRGGVSTHLLFDPPIGVGHHVEPRHQVRVSPAAAVGTS